jgi:hypothetical protein
VSDEVPGRDGALGSEGADGMPPPHAAATATRAEAVNKVTKVNLMTNILLGR